MPFKIEVDRQNQIVIARVMGRASQQEHRQAREQAAASCTENHFKKLLVDLRDLDTEAISTAGSLTEYGHLLAADESLKDVYIAHVVPKKDISEIDVDFAITIAEMEGKTSEQFISFEEAREWLIQQPWPTESGI